MYGEVPVAMPLDCLLRKMRNVTGAGSVFNALEPLARSSSCYVDRGTGEAHLQLQALEYFLTATEITVNV